jgi:protein-arginine kinase activator protein McsA
MKENILNTIGSGWHRYIETVYTMLPELPFCSGVSNIERKNGMLHVTFSCSALTTPEQEFILTAIEYKLERITARVCEECGAHGFRRTELSEVKTLCTRCYAYVYSALHPTPSMMAHPEPHTNY